NVKDVKQYDIVLDSAIGGEEHFKDKFGLRISITKAASILPKSFRYKVESLEKSENIIVEILNGTNISGLAERCRKYLQNYEDIDVQIISAARKKDYTNTLIIDRKGNLKSAQRIKDILKIGEIQTDINVSAVVDIRIILGKDIAEILK
ncbi:MAG TPA: LytR C-terminal domain-containing protein, partial [bacterium]|nr:LytR C-terminal domain-containing protein [bacterium]